MVKRIITIPDVHGRLFWNDVKEKSKEDDLIIFLGDYLDPYPDENIDNEEAIKNFKNIIGFKKSHDNCILLLGNHDIGYIYPEVCQCRRDVGHYAEIANLFYDNKEIFQIIYKYYCESNGVEYLFSHAGVHKKLLKEFELNIDDFNELFINQDYNFRRYLSIVSSIRGGIGRYGSCVWADAREFVSNYREKSNTYQIFGHTQIKQHYIADDFACLDCHKCFVIYPEQKIIEEL